METHILRRRIYLEPKYLDSNIMLHLLRKINKKMSGEIDKDYGYFISANRIVKILDNTDTFFFLEIEAKTYKPKIGQKVKGFVCIIYKDGFLVNVFERMMVLVPSIFIKDYVFDENKNTFENNNIRIGMGDKIKVEIKQCRFHEKKFECIGFLA